ncbi:MAG: biotin/lipoyl-binding protein, partial [Bacteroidota bacterium]|nr:biotin/lipoyl-binding protein [Bacteroidota bacterium]
MENKVEIKEGKRKRIVGYIPLAVIVLAVLAGSLYWYHEYMRYVKTDDAHIDSDNVAISSKILGRIMHLYVDEGDSVKKGMLLAELDSADLVAQLHQAVALKNQNTASLTQFEAKYRFDLESMRVPEVGLDKAREDYDRAKNQYAGQVT